MNHIKKNRENLSEMIIRAKNRCMKGSVEQEKGVEIFSTEGNLLGVAYPESELAMKWATIALSLMSKDAELCQLENILTDRERDKSPIVRPPVRIQ